MTFDQLYERVETALTAADYRHDNLLPSKICIGLCEHLQLNNSQRAGVDDAKLFHASQIDEQHRLESNERLSIELDAFHHRGDVQSPEEAMQRLAWATLVTTEGLSPYMGEFLIDEAKNAGLSADQIAGVFDRLVPTFALTAQS